METVLQFDHGNGREHYVAFPVHLLSGAPSGGVTITLISSDPTKVTVSPSTVFIAALTTAPVTQPQVTGVNLGSASISASAPGFNGDSETVTVGAALTFVPPTLSLGTGATQKKS